MTNAPTNSTVQLVSGDFTFQSLVLTSSPPEDAVTLSIKAVVIGSLGGETVFTINQDLVHDIPTTVSNSSLIDLLTVVYTSPVSLANLSICAPFYCTSPTTTVETTETTQTTQPTASFTRPALTTTTNNPGPTLISLPCNLSITTNGQCGSSNGKRCPDNYCCGPAGYCQDDGGTEGEPWCNFLPSKGIQSCQLGYGKCFIETNVQVGCPNWTPTSTVGPDLSLPVQAWVGPQGGRCGTGIGYRCADDYCCGPSGYCQDDGGTAGAAWCGKYCQPGYGKCFADSLTSTTSIPATTTVSTSTSPASTWVTLLPDTSFPVSKNGQCGFQYGTRCKDNYCCSDGGYCQDDGGTEGLDWCGPANCQVGYGKCFATSPPVNQQSSYQSSNFTYSIPIRNTTHVCFNVSMPHFPDNWVANANYQSSNWSIIANLTGLEYDSASTKTFSLESWEKAIFTDASNILTITPNSLAHAVVKTGESFTFGFCTKRLRTLEFAHTITGHYLNDIAPVYVQCQDNKMAITFDDGPCDYTDALLDALEALNATATFFVVGTKNCNTGDWFPTLRRIVANGHQLALHTWSHVSIPYQPENTLNQQLLKNENLVFAATGVRPRYMRPPFGDWDTRSAKVMAKLGYNVVSWAATSDDWAMVDSAGNFDVNIALQHVDSQLNALNPNYPSQPLVGGSILNHDVIKTTSLDFAAKLVQLVRAKGYELTTMADCVGDTQPYRPDPATQSTQSTSSTQSTQSTSSTQSTQSISSTQSTQSISSTQSAQSTDSTQSSTSSRTESTSGSTKSTSSAKSTSSTSAKSASSTKATSTQTKSTKTTKTPSGISSSTKAAPMTLVRRNQGGFANTRPRKIDLATPSSVKPLETSKSKVKRATSLPLGNSRSSPWLGFVAGLAVASTAFSVAVGLGYMQRKPQRMATLPRSPTKNWTPGYFTQPGEEPQANVTPRIVRVASSGYGLTPSLDSPTLFPGENEVFHRQSHKPE
jgi:peptidoglycan/xylan/chitin deacetylase (PgdA/CDA1 family)